MVERQYRILIRIDVQTYHHIDFDSNQEPTAKAFYRTLRDKGVRVSFWEREVGEWGPSQLEETANRG